MQETPRLFITGPFRHLPSSVPLRAKVLDANSKPAMEKGMVRVPLPRTSYADGIHGTAFKR